ncbi:MAG: DUF2141 domain-containing protein [Saprospiraceae bacterium]|nr:DUF2141 domain-containing protein [Saprospiraceae bacterium]
MVQVFLFYLVSMFSIKETPCDLLVTIPNIKGKQGNIVIGVYNDREKFPKVGMQYREVRFPASTAGSTFRIEDLNPGTYALGIYHDTNTDGICNTNFLGVPREGYGFSNNIKPVLKAPSFEECKIKLTGDMKLTVQLIY